jgi:phosphoglycerol transferase
VSASGHRNLLRGLAYFAAFFLLATGIWLRANFGEPTIQQIIYHLYFLDTLVLDADNLFLVSFGFHCVLAPAVVAYLCVAGERLVRAWSHRVRSAAQTQPRTRMSRAAIRTVAALPLLLLTFGVSSLAAQVSAFSYVRSKFGADHFAEAFVSASSVELRGDGLKNLVLIYVESLETTYTDPTIFGRNLIPELTALPGVSFGDYRQAPGTGWTIAGIVATQCGVPLQFVTRVGSRDAGEHVDVFLPGAICLPDILHQFGYYNVFVGGAHLTFAGKDRFLRDHHYDETFGYHEYLRSKTKLHGVNGWGLFDDDLFVQAKAKFLELTQSGKRFNLTVLTLDTHHPDGHYSASCVAQGARAFEDIVRCSSAEVARFVEFIRDGGHLATTNIVIIGDHLAMPNPVWDKLTDAKERRIFNKFLSADVHVKLREGLLPFDLLPTITEFIGIDVVGDRLGLGYSGFGAVDPPASRPEESYDILNFSSTYEDLWVEPAPLPRAQPADTLADR